MITLAFGSPGAGKTTYIARLVQKNKKKGLSFSRKYNHIYSNVRIMDVNYFDSKDLGTFHIEPNSLVIIDEASIEFNNRLYKTMPVNIIRFLKLHRHYGCDIIFFSQDFEDCDITIRRLASKLLYLRSVMNLTICRKVRKFVFIEKDKHQIMYGYSFHPFWHVFTALFTGFPFTMFYRPKYYLYFDSWDAPQLPDPKDKVEHIPFKRVSFLKRLKVIFKCEIKYIIVFTLVIFMISFLLKLLF